ncbi:hypothetical protein CLG96_07720 [Sphingomonas oleivorans]|uniref:Beta-lactamase-related domain-containing protein n=1 Tax=Sphingomonas oleivorans TaxID=1735121 RepID=A0A2T5FYW5_9SPHN|nr:serine hydrolase [Sphingomonas oleivorans]PTQ11806.1 hypothetical protein CLG96_07720 [Sphingomonas oleivorans]
MFDHWRARHGSSAGGRRFIAFILAIATATSGGFAAPQRDFTQIDAQIEEARRTWQQPGLAVAVVEDGRVIHARGFGTRNMSTGEPVDADTVFGIGSCTKSFVSATAGQLVESGRLKWDDRVRDHLPWFALHDEATTNMVTLRDLLAMRTGLEGSPGIFREIAKDRTDLVRRMRYLKPLAPFRSEMVYTTDNYTAAGLVVAQIAGTNWETVAQNQIWGPLGMTHTNADHRVARALSNSASPHMAIDGRMAPIPWIYEDHVALPAGGVNSSVNDMARWLMVLLGQGSWNGKQILQPSTVQEMETPHTPNRGHYKSKALATILGEGPDGVRFMSYALGLGIQDYHGSTVVQHDGAIDGFRCTLAMLPEKKFGVVVLLNGPYWLLGHAVTQLVLDYALDLPAKDWPAAFKAYSDHMDREEMQEEQRIQGQRNPRLPALSSSAYASRYHDDGAFGEVEIKAEPNGKLIMSAGPVTYELQHWRRDTFAVVKRWPYPVPRSFFVSFLTDAAGEVTGFKTSYGGEFHRTEPSPGS